jgi:hypothetical protein
VVATGRRHSDGAKPMMGAHATRQSANAIGTTFIVVLDIRYLW